MCYIDHDMSTLVIKPASFRLQAQFFNQHAASAPFDLIRIGDLFFRQFRQINYFVCCFPRNAMCTYASTVLLLASISLIFYQELIICNFIMYIILYRADKKLDRYLGLVRLVTYVWKICLDRELKTSEKSILSCVWKVFVSVLYN